MGVHSYFQCNSSWLTVTDIILGFRGIKSGKNSSTESESTPMGGQRMASELAFWNVFHGTIRRNHSPTVRKKSFGQIVLPSSEPSPPVLEP